MTFDTFLQSLTKIAEWKYGSEDKVGALQALVNEHFVPLHEKIEA